MKQSLFFLILLFAFHNLYSQIVDAGRNDTICLGESVKLSGRVEGDDFLYYYWKSDPTLTDTTNLNVVVTPEVTTTYYLYGYKPENFNFVGNGDFRLGDVQFQSDYTYVDGMVNWRQYTIATIGTDGNALFYPHYDHTLGNAQGKFMCIDAATTPNERIWYQQINNITPNTQYVFYTWVATLYADNPDQVPKLQFSINGALLDQPFEGPYPRDKGWERFYTIWESGNNTSVQIEIVNQRIVATGNDLGLDDITFTEVIPIIDSVTIFVGKDTVCEIADTLCHGSSYFFAGKKLTTSGVYRDTTQTVLGCDSITILYLMIGDPVDFDLGADIRVCKESTPEVRLSSPLGDYIYEWSTGETSSAITVTQTGTYHLTITDKQGCFAKDSIVVTFINTPEVEIVNHTGEFCDRYSAVLEAVTDASHVSWNNGETTHTITVDQPGAYRVVARREMCNSSSYYVIDECDFNLFFPTAISPNDANGLNDYFAFSDPEVVKSAKVCIYNRWGELLFYSEDPYFKWDGTHNGKLCPAGTYSYTIHIVAKTGKSYYYRGALVVI
ncbi:gliding motility-associated C-terminal domain-containing protein [Bacteroidales bacterium OttesenSCG-928-B11]|nr:gliding motility-associated C-terminal domain-containing protein [Bacteroidales bacterium OttesenSCG-928-E04]MDL2312484.1 gliding motility-associated C-terminal domain-containing protein [Bacteroidales bacterium OttesenSCG-928-B11]MDL2325715.1 gliding motility-associated C-terminal domain-containing protein [Bacteroidales bacterium OttesenSCG-928-A14]